MEPCSPSRKRYKLEMYRRIAIRNVSKQQGIGLPAAIFLITIMALIVVAMSELNESSALGFGQDLNSMKAFYAAESGAQVALNRVFNGDEACDNSLASIDFGTTPGLSGCSAVLTCSQVNVAATGGIQYRTFRSTATCGGGFEQATRSIEVRAHEG